MKKLTALLLAAILLLAGIQTASALGMTFTHPELGEPMTLGYVNHMPYFKIYGFTYYQIVDPATPHRGLLSNQTALSANKMPTAEESLNAIFDSVEGKDGGVMPVVFAYTGALEPYNEQISALERKDKVRATLLLNGFSGAKGYDAMAKIPGFEEEDFSELKDGYTEFTARVGKKVYPYRVIQFYVEEKDFHEYYFERYNYIRMDGEWRLLHITKEYADVTMERETYVHGMVGYSAETAYDNIYPAMWDYVWGDAKEDVATAPGAVVDGKDYAIADAMLFRIPCGIAFGFDGKELDSITYTFRNEQSFYSAFVSLYIRLADPVFVADNGDITWSLNDTYLYLRYDKQAPTLTVSREGRAR